MKKKALVLLFLGLIFFLTTARALAAKQRVRRGGNQTTAKSTGYSQGVRTSVRLRPDRRALLINFSDFGNASSATYTLIYTANGIAQGAGGTASPETAGQQRELLFGTCSAGVCRYHTNITNARLTIDSKLRSGLIVRKPYRIKI